MQSKSSLSIITIFYYSRSMRKHTGSNEDVTEVITLDVDSDGESSSRKKTCVQQTNGARSSTSQEVRLLENEENVTNIINFLVRSLQPVSYVGDPVFRQYSYALNSKYIFPSVDSIETGLTFQYEMLRSRIEHELKEIAHISISTECWQTIVGDTYVTIRGHFIDSDWCTHSYVLATCQLQSRINLNEQIDKHVEAVSKAWNVQNRIASVTYDTGEMCGGEDSDDGDARPRRPNYDRIACVATVLQKSVMSAIGAVPDADRLIRKCSTLVSFFHTNRTADIYLVKYQKSIEMPNVALPRLNPNEFNPYYTFLNTILQQKNTICAVLNDNGAVARATAREIALNEHEWEQLKQLVTVLKTFELTKTIIFADDGDEGTVSVTKPLIDTLSKNFLLPKEGEDDPMLLQVKQSIRKELNINYKMYYEAEDSDIGQPDCYDIAMYFDPRYKFLICLNDRHRRNVCNYINDRILQKQQSSTINGDGGSSSNAHNFNHHNASTLTASVSRRSAVDILFGSTPECEQTKQMAVECFQYSLEPEIDKYQPFRDWWKANAKRFPTLAIEAKRYLCARAAAKPLYAQQNLYERRACLPPHCIDQFLFLYNNRDIDNPP